MSDLEILREEFVKAGFAGNLKEMRRYRMMNDNMEILREEFVKAGYTGLVEKLDAGKSSIPQLLKDYFLRMCETFPGGAGTIRFRVMAILCQHLENYEVTSCGEAEARGKKKKE